MKGDKLLDAFYQEVNDLLESLESSLLTLEQDMQDEDLIAQIFRDMHTIKGTSQMFGFDKMGDFVHRLETIFDLARYGEIAVSKELVEISLASTDLLKELVLDKDVADESNARILEDIIGQMSNLEVPANINMELENSEQDNNDSDVDNQISFSSIRKEMIDEDANLISYYIFFKPNKDILSNGTNLLYLLDEIDSLGTTWIKAHTKDVPSLDKLDATLCYTYWEIILVSNKPINSVIDVFMFVEDDAETIIEELAPTNLLNNKDFKNKITDPAYEKRIDFAEIKELYKDLSTDPIETINDNKTDKTVTKENDQNEKSSRKEVISSTIRVDSEKLDELMGIVSEVVTTQASMSLLAQNSDHIELVEIAENFEKLSRQLRDNAFGMTLVPIETMLSRFQRLIRDTSNSLGKDIQFITKGGETELDKTVIESLVDPLMHILKNSIDHGIEEKEDRIKKKKPTKGTITLEAYYSGSNVHIKIQDDGKGIDRDVIRQSAIKRGIITVDAELSESEIFDLLFAPGFSTAEKVTDVSGRGVGMDVVKKNITNLKGEILVESELGVGTTLTIILPLTLSIVDGLLVKIGSTNFIIQLSVIDKCYEVNREEMDNNFNKLLILDEEQIPFIDVRKEFDINDDAPDITQMIVVNNGIRKVGITVDQIVGEYQAVLKPLGKYYKYQEYVSGATILGDGSVALVFDTNKIISEFSNESVLTA